MTLYSLDLYMLTGHGKLCNCKAKHDHQQQFCILKFLFENLKATESDVLVLVFMHETLFQLRLYKQAWHVIFCIPLRHGRMINISYGKNYIMLFV